jgi:hypothetical protein
LAVGVTGDAHQSADGLDKEVVTGTIPAARLAEAGDRAVNGPRVDRGDAVGVQAVAGEAAGPEVLHHDVGAASQLDRPGAAIRVSEIERHAVLAAVETFVIGRRLGGPRRPPRPRLVTRARPLDLDDGRTEVGQRHRCQRAGENAAEVGDEQPVERCVHAAAGMVIGRGTALLGSGSAPTLLNPARPTC